MRAMTAMFVKCATLGDTTDAAEPVEGRACALTVGELMARLEGVPTETPVTALYDCRCAGGNVVTVELGPGPDDSRESVLLIIE